MSNPTLRSVREQTIDANQQILSNADAIVANWPADESTAVCQRALLINDLCNFKNGLKEHLELEASSGYLSDALALVS